MLYRLKRVGLTFALLLSASATQALVIEHSSTFSLNNTNNYHSTTGSSLSDSSTRTTTANLSRFDSSLGTLTGVDVSFTSTWNHYSYASAYDSSAASTFHADSNDCGFWGTPGECGNSYYTYSNDTYVNSRSGAQFTIALTDPSSTSVSALDSNYVGCSNGYSNRRSASSTNCSDSDLTITSFNGNLDLAGFSLSQFVGTNDLDFSLTNFAWLSGNCDNNDSGDRCTAYNDAYWSGRINVAYTYDAFSVPEPASLLLLGAGLLGFGATRKRSK